MMRRFLGGGSASDAAQMPTDSDMDTIPPPSPPSQPTQPLSIKPSWPPTDRPSSPAANSLPGTPIGSPRTTTAGLFFRKDKQKPLPIPSETDTAGSHVIRPRTKSNASNKSPARPHPPSLPPQSPISTPLSRPPSRPATVGRKSVNYASPTRPPPNTTRDQLLMSLLSSEAVVDSTNYDVLTSEEVEELKKEQSVLTSRLTAAEKKLGLEIKIRDAAISLSKVNANYKSMSKQTNEQLAVSERKVDAAQKEVWRLSARVNEVGRKLLEHRAGVLSLSVRTLEKQAAPANNDTYMNGRETPARRAATPSSVASSSPARFDGAHFYAGHADTIVPQLPRPPPSAEDVTVLENQLKAATDSLAAASKKQAELNRELTMLRLEKEQVETSLGMEIQSQEETIDALEHEVSKFNGVDAQVQDLLAQRDTWDRDRAELEEGRRQIDILERRLELLEEQSGEASQNDLALARVTAERERLERELDDARAKADRDRIAWQKGREEDALRIGDDLRKAQDDLAVVEEDARAQEEALDLTRAEMDEVLNGLQSLAKIHGIVVADGDSSPLALVASFQRHLRGVSEKFDAYYTAQAEWEEDQQRLQADIEAGLIRNQALTRQVEDARRERDRARKDSRTLDGAINEHADTASPRPMITPISMSPVSETGEDASKIIAALLPIWQALPSAEARAARLQSRASPVPNATSPLSPSSPASPKSKKNSLSDLDVRSLKVLYDGVPTPSRISGGAVGGPFSIEAFVGRVQALIADDRALVERLVRFAQAHDLLKKNAERAQKLAIDSNAALETYQKQVRMLEERNATVVQRQVALEDEIHRLEDTVERITAAKLEIETLAAQQAEQVLELGDANNTLSARALTLAQEAASAGDGLRRQMEAQLNEYRTALAKAEEEVEAMRTSDQSQRIQLLDEMTTLQTENESLRAQLRARK